MSQAELDAIWRELRDAEEQQRFWRRRITALRKLLRQTSAALVEQGPPWPPPDGHPDSHTGLGTP